ncbi:hypothetical protein B0T21DRAFT_367050 [Apiosordaria backusii]|uniref:Uncharacterized protein n=1 Tax=Apiosordaria backusii TaxID=314023 RepID=A0AA40ECM5_9PEZI|nr:hypothetical protein B0T21DRAFT_367050 [Apiosordaria backusii]
MFCPQSYCCTVQLLSQRLEFAQFDHPFKLSSPRAKSRTWTAHHQSKTAATSNSLDPPPSFRNKLAPTKDCQSWRGKPPTGMSAAWPSPSQSLTQPHLTYFSHSPISASQNLNLTSGLVGSYYGVLFLVTRCILYR